MTIQQKLLMISISGAVPTVACLAVSFMGLQKVDPEKSALFAYAASLANQMRADMMHDALRADVQASVMAATGEERKAVEADVKMHGDTIQKMFDRNQKLEISDQAKSSIAALRIKMASYTNLATRIVEQRARGAAVDEKALADFRKLFDELEQEMRKFDDYLEREAEHSRSAAIASIKGSKVATSLFAAVLLLAAAVFSSRSVTSELRKGIDKLMTTADHLGETSNKIVQSSQSLENAASQQAGTLRTISVCSETIHTVTKRNLESCRMASESSNLSRQKFQSAGVALDQMVEAMLAIDTHSGEISKIIRTIDNIAFQTNILALNAAVEAARAGQAGAGFSVVTDQFRGLARRSTDAARETAVLIAESVQRTNTGKAKVAELNTVIRQITEDADVIQAQVEAVGASSGEQTRGVQEVSSGLRQLENATQVTATSARESAATARNLNGQSGKLREVVSDLSALIGI